MSWFSRAIKALTDPEALLMIAVAYAIGFATGGPGMGAVRAGIKAAAIVAANIAIQAAFAPGAPQIRGQNQDQVRGTHRVGEFPARWVVGRARIGPWWYSAQEGSPADYPGRQPDQPKVFRTAGLAHELCYGGYDAIEGIWINGAREDVAFVKSVSATGVITTYGEGETVPRDAMLVAGPDSEYRPTGVAGDLDLLKNQRWAICPRPATSGEPPSLASPNVVFGFDNIPGASVRDPNDRTMFTADTYEANGSGVAFVRLVQPVRKVLQDAGEERDLVWNSIPNIEYLVRGIRIRWPKDATGALTDEPAWTENAAAIIWWFLTERMGYRADEIDAGAFRAAYDRCAEVVRPTGQPDGYPESYTRYTVNGTISADDDPSTVLRELLFAMAGSLVEIDDKLHMFAGTERAATKTLGDADIIETGEIRPAPALQDRSNAMTMGLVESAEHDYTAYEMPKFVDADGLARDRRELLTEMGSRAFVNHPARAQMLMAIAMRRSRGQAIHSYRVRRGDPAGATVADRNANFLLVPGERILVTDSEAGLVSVPMEVMEVDLEADMSVGLVLRHSPPGIYADDAVSLPALVPTPALPPRTADRPPDVAGLSLAGFASLNDGRITSTLVASWTDSDWPTQLILFDPDGGQQRTVVNGASHTYVVPGTGAYTVTAVHLSGPGAESRAIATASTTLLWDHIVAPAVAGLAAAASVAVEAGAVVSRVTASWTVSASPTDVHITGPGGFDVTERVAPRVASITFLVPAEGNYPVSAAHVVADTGRVGAQQHTAVDVSWDALRPPALPSPRVQTFATLGEQRYQLELGVIVEWGTTAEQVVVRIERGDYQDERVVEQTASARFVVPETGTYSVVVHQQRLGGVLVGESTTLSADVSTTSLRPTAPTVTATPHAEKVDDGTIRSRVALAWGATPDRARVRIWQGTTFEQEIDTLEEEATFDVPNEGDYNWSVTLFNAAETGPAATGTVAVSWAHLAPISTVAVIRFTQGGGGSRMLIILAQPSERDLAGIDLRYRVQDINDESALPVIDDASWDTAPRLETAPIAVGYLGNNVIINADVPRTGRYRVFGRWVSRAGLRGPVGEIGTGVFALPTGNAGSADFSILWPGVLTDVGPLPDSEHGSILVFDPGNIRDLPRERLNGEEGWPFGREATPTKWEMALPRANAREAPTSLQARWRPGAGGLGGSPVLPEAWLVAGVSDRTQYLRDVLLTRTTTSGPVSVTVRFRPDPLSGNTTTDPFLTQGVEQNALWELSWGDETINLGGPDEPLPGAVRDATNPYTWTPRTAAQALLGELMDGLAAGTVSSVTLRIAPWEQTEARYLSPAVDLGKAANWLTAIQQVIVQPPNPPLPGPQAPTPDATAVYTLRYGVTDALGNTRTVTPGEFTLLPATQWIQVDVALGPAWLGTGIITLRAEWQEQL